MTKETEHILELTLNKLVNFYGMITEGMKTQLITEAKKEYFSNLKNTDLDKLKHFIKKDEGIYSDNIQFTIINRQDICALFLYDNVDNTLTFIKQLNDLNDLKNVYHAITDTVLEFN